MSVIKRILFVDDDASILAGLQNLLYKDRKRWDMVFALGGKLALAEVHKAPFDIVVSDMRMPDIDGAQLLGTIRDEYPSTVRIMLSGHADRDAIVRLLPTLHQLLVKPCNVATLRGVIERSSDGVNVERDAKIRQIVGAVDKLPTPPEVYFELSRLLQSATAGVNDVAKVVARDPALAAKVLQLVNCSYFSAGQVTTSIAQAVSLLGTEQLRYIALTASVFSGPATAAGGTFSLAEAQQTAIRAANLARAFAEPAQREEAFASSLLHDLGHVVLALCRGPQFQLYTERVARGERELDVELDLFGVTHADVGARLLAIWGLPPALVDAVQFHHDPGSAPDAYRRLASIVHVASALSHRKRRVTDVDLPSLERAGCAALVTGWCAIADRTESRAG
jgi:HD-like signal output (HDOD) protein